MDLISTPGKPLLGQVNPPGDKSLSHRACLLAALAYGQSRIENFLIAGVIEPMLMALQALGVAWRLEGTTLTVLGRGLEGFLPPRAPLDCGNSATTLRLLAGALSAAGIPVVLDGSAGLRRRPMRRIVEPLREMGVPVQAAPGDTAPLRLEARPVSDRLRGLAHSLPVASAQVKSCLLLAGLAADGPVTLIEPGPSRDHTERMLASMGVKIERLYLPKQGEYLTRLYPPSGRKLSPIDRTLTGDVSSAAFLIVAALIVPGSDICLRGVGLNPTRTGLLDALTRMGAQITIEDQRNCTGEPLGDLYVRYSHLQGVSVDGATVVRMIDEFPAFAVAAACASGTTAVSQAGELRHKESDRIAALCSNLNALGVEAYETEDGFRIHGGGIPGGVSVEPHGDHRLAMALAIAGLAGSEPVMVRSAEVIAESYPGFVHDLCSLGADLEWDGP